MSLPEQGRVRPARAPQKPWGPRAGVPAQGRLLQAYPDAGLGDGFDALTPEAFAEVKRVCAHKCARIRLPRERHQALLLLSIVPKKGLASASANLRGPYFAHRVKVCDAIQFIGSKRQEDALALLLAGAEAIAAK